MTKQIAVRLPDELVEFLDGAATHESVSRATIVARALARERRRAIAARDAEILAASPSTDLDALSEHVVRLPIDLD